MTCNRIWIELEAPKDLAHAMAQCLLANNMLAKLGDMGGEKFFASDRKRVHYCFGGPMGYRDLTDNGEWFNLDYFAK